VGPFCGWMQPEPWNPTLWQYGHGLRLRGLPILRRYD
jgi:hypothetical protein